MLNSIINMFSTPEEQKEKAMSQVVSKLDRKFEMEKIERLFDRAVMLEDYEMLKKAIQAGCKSGRTFTINNLDMQYKFSNGRLVSCVTLEIPSEPTY